MALFDKKEKENPLVNQVSDLRKQGMADSQIIQTLTQQGYKNYQIFDALNLADLQNPAGSMQQQAQNMQSMQQMQSPQQMTGQMGQQLGGVAGQYTEEEHLLERQRLEELIETIIEEKWKPLAENISKVAAWKDQAETKVQKIEAEIDLVKREISELRVAIMGKVSEYDQHITEIGSELKAIDQVFTKVVPKMTETVGELSRITDKLKTRIEGPAKK